ncbi:CMRF35-like molecule 1 [Lates calcarifer]|uniref:CMRF35-like molecule 1 n=1 Tax=Lates calcarifer TaxID=8187 RepID=A0AAJ7VG64_LATCA|nr:CMRF35-like molecule 1 [Lates calcarifer]
MDKDTDYWCAVEINRGDDIRKYFHLSVTRGKPSLYVDHQEMTGFNGDSITISCKYTTAGEIKWCRLGRNCVTGSSGSIDGTTVSINSSVPNVFTVTMSGLTTQSSGWYLCVKGDFQMPVHVTVTEKPTTTTLAAATHLTSSFPTSEPVTLTPVMGDEASTTEQHSVSVDVRNPIISLSLLIFIAMVALFIWFMLRKHKQTKAVSPPMTEQSYPESDVDVTYSSVVIVRRQGVRRVEANDENVIYSTLA